MTDRAPEGRQPGAVSDIVERVLRALDRSRHMSDQRPVLLEIGAGAMRPMLTVSELRLLANAARAGEDRERERPEWLDDATALGMATLAATMAGLKMTDGYKTGIGPEMRMMARSAYEQGLAKLKASHAKSFPPPEGME